MNLGNSKRQNRGKVYVKDKSQIDQVFAALAVDFEQWFGLHYTQLQSQLKHKECYDEDILNETYIRIYENIMFCGIEIKNYKAYFHRSYFTNYMAVKIHGSKNRDIDIKEELIGSKEYISNDVSYTQNAMLDIFARILTDREAQLIRMHYTNSQLTIKDIARMIGIRHHTAYYILRQAKRKLREEKKLLSLFN